jgi:hypothetical protein
MKNHINGACAPILTMAATTLRTAHQRAYSSICSSGINGSVGLSVTSSGRIGLRCTPVVVRRTFVNVGDKVPINYIKGEFITIYFW